MMDEKKGVFFYANSMEDFGNLENELEEKFLKHKGLVYYFANKHPIEFMEYEDYTQSLLLKFWELVKKFDWNKFNKDDSFNTNRTFCGFVKRGLTRYFYDLLKQNYKDKEIFTSISLDKKVSDEDDDMFFIDFISDESNIENTREKQYYLETLKDLKDKGEIEGYLILYINGLNYTKIASEFNCSRGKVKRKIEKELDKLRKVCED